MLRHTKDDGKDRVDRDKDREDKERRSVRVLSTCRECVTRTSSSMQPNQGQEPKAMDLLVIPWEQVTNNQMG